MTERPGVRRDRANLRRYGLATATAIGCIVLSVRIVGAQESSPDLSGVWSTTVTTFGDPAWSVEDLFACNCTSATYEYINRLLHDPTNDHLSAEELQRVVRAYNMQMISSLQTEAGREHDAAYDHADDPAIQCEPFGAFRTILHNDPIEFEHYSDNIVIRTEDMASDRTIYVDGRGHPVAEPTSLGHSIGWFEGSTLVVETVGVSANVADDNLPIHNSDQATSVERYTISEDGSRLHMTFTLTDPVRFREPLTLERTRIFTPQVPLEDAPCESISGQR